MKVLVEGAKMGPERIKHVIPIFEEGTVDEDLLNEGNRRVRDYYQRLGYFDVKVDHERRSEGSDQVVIVYKVQPGTAPPRGKGLGRGKPLFRLRDAQGFVERSCRRLHLTVMALTARLWSTPI